MGCGQSHIAVIYPRKSKQKGSSPQSELELLPRKKPSSTFKARNVCLRIREAGEENSDEERSEKGINEKEASGEETQVAAAQLSAAQAAEEEEAAARLRQMVALSNSPLLAHQELSNSQNDFFKMLDDKINNGPDYDGINEFEFAMDHAQLCRLLQEWQSAKHKSKYSQSQHGQSQHGQSQHKLQKYHSVQSNGEPPGMKPRLSHQSSLYSSAPPGAVAHPYAGYAPSHYDPYQMRHYQPPPQHVYQPPPPQHYPHQMPPSSYQQPPGYQPPPPAYGYQQPPPPQQQYPQQFHHHMGASSVVMYDKRGGYYTELA